MTDEPEATPRYVFDVLLGEGHEYVTANDWSREGDSILFWNEPKQTDCVAMFAFDRIVGVTRGKQVEPKAPSTGM